MKLLRITAFALSVLSPALAWGQVTAPQAIVGYLSTVGCPGGATVCFVQYGSAIPVTGTFSLSGFTPNGTDATPLSVSNSSSETALPATSTVVMVQNVGANVAYVKLGTTSGVTATTSDLAVPALGGCAVTVVANGFIAGITASSTTTLNLIGGSGLGNSCYGGGSGSGGGGGAVYGPTAAGSAAANPPVLMGGTVDGTSTGNVDNWKVASGLGYVSAVIPSGGVASGAIASGAIASGAVASGAVASGAYASGAISDGADVTQGSKADAKSTATDTTAITIMQVLKEISAMEQAPASRAVTNAGTFATQSAITAASGSIASGAVASGAVASGAFASGSISDGAEVTIGSKADAKNSATDTTAITIMQVLKEISSLEQAPASRAVTNAGTFAVQATLNATPTLANGNGVVPTIAGAVYSATNGAYFNLLQGNAVISATNGIYGNILQGNAVISATNGLFSNQLQGNAVLSVTNPTFTEITDGSNGAAAIKAASTAPVAADKALVITVSPNAGTAVATAVSGLNASLVQGVAYSAEQTKCTTADTCWPALDLVGKQVTSPYANRENMTRGTASETGTSAGTILPASGSASLKEYLVALQCGRTDAGTTAIYVTLNDSASSIVALPNNGGGGGNNITFPVPLVAAANTALTFTASSGVSTVYCNGQGYNGY